MFRSIDLRPALLWFSLSFTIVIVLGAVTFTSPYVQSKFESLHYRMEALLPQPPHTEFVPTPMPTRPGKHALVRPPLSAGFVGPVLNPTHPANGFIGPMLDPTPTTRPTGTPIKTAKSQMLATQTRIPTQNSAATLNGMLAAVKLNGVTHDYQRWNNCGPTTVEMALSFFGRHESQAEIAAVLKPDPEDKNVNPDELASYARVGRLSSIVRIDGSLDRIKVFLSNGLPVIVETGFDPPQAHEGWMGHYRLITGYNDKAFITQDSYDGPNVAIAFSALDDLWRDFNRTYVVIYTNDQAPLVQAVLGTDADDSAMYEGAVAQAKRELASNPNDAFAAFNLGSSLVGLAKYDEAASVFDNARVLGLPWRMLWYQFGPYEAYLHVGRYGEVVALAAATLKPAPDLEESHYYKGLALENLGQVVQARAEFTLALQYNKNYTAAKLELTQLAQQ